MLDDYIVKEVKVLDIDVEKTKEKLKQLKATEVYNDERVIRVMDTENGDYLKNQDKLIRITEEAMVKITMHVNQTHQEAKREIKCKMVNRVEDILTFFNQLGLNPIAKVVEHRTSYELRKVDFDIDEFPTIPPFLEIDTEDLPSIGMTLDELLTKLELQDHKVIVAGTEEIHALYNIDYFKVYACK